jgi:hypothetical protein
MPLLCALRSVTAGIAPHEHSLLNESKISAVRTRIACEFGSIHLFIATLCEPKRHVTIPNDIGYTAILRNYEIWQEKMASVGVRLPFSAFLFHIPFAKVVIWVTEVQLVAAMQHEVTALMSENISIVALTEFPMQPNFIVAN